MSKVESVDPERHVYRASVRFDGIDYLVDVWLATDGGRLRLKLFDDRGPARGALARADHARVGVLRDVAPQRAAHRA